MGLDAWLNFACLSFGLGLVLWLCYGDTNDEDFTTLLTFANILISLTVSELLEQNIEFKNWINWKFH